MSSNFRVRIDVRHHEVDRLFRTQEARHLVERAADACARAANEAAPVGATGETSRSYEGFGSEIVDGVATAYFGSRSSIWHIIEFGSVNNPAYRPMTKGVERVGLKYRPSR